jgi:precorrin-3B C17-methyltransferase
MLTTVVIGNSSSRLAGKKILTPRGYFEKYG